MPAPSFEIIHMATNLTKSTVFFRKVRKRGNLLVAAQERESDGLLCFPVSSSFTTTREAHNSTAEGMFRGPEGSNLVLASCLLDCFLMFAGVGFMDGWTMDSYRVVTCTDREIQRKIQLCSSKPCAAFGSWPWASCRSQVSVEIPNPVLSVLSGFCWGKSVRFEAKFALFRKLGAIVF